MGAKLLRGDRRTDRHDEVIVAFRNVSKAPKDKKGWAGNVMKKWQ